MRKSYKLREAGKWYPTKSLEQAARIDIKKQYLQLHPAGKILAKRLTSPRRKTETLTQYNTRIDSAQLELDTAIDHIINKLAKTEKGTDYFSLMGQKERLTNQNLKNAIKDRLKMPTSVENFLGRIDEPLSKFEISTTKLVRDLESRYFYDDLHEMGRGLYFFKNAKQAPKGFDLHQIPKGHGKLSEMWTNDANARFIQEINEVNLFMGKGSAAKLMLAGSLVKGMMHAVNTIFSHGTQVVNVVGAGIATLANGNNPFSKEFLESTYMLMKRGAKTTDPKMQALI